MPTERPMRAMRAGIPEHDGIRIDRDHRGQARAEWTVQNNTISEHVLADASRCRLLEVFEPSRAWTFALRT